MKLIATSALALFIGSAAMAETEISFALWGSPEEGAVWEHIAEAFEASHPGISVKIEVSDWDGYWEKLRVQVAGGAAPDIFAMDAPLYPDWQSRGVLMNLQPMIDAEPGLLDDVFPATLEAYRTEDGLFGLPRDFQTIVLYYNKTMFDAAGIAYPDESWTWDSLADAARALTLDKDGDGTTDQWGIWGEFYDMEPFWGALVWANGGDVVNPETGETLIGSPEAMAAFEWIRGLMLDDGAIPTTEQLTQYGWDGFLAGVSAMGLSGHWSVPEYTAAGLVYDVAPLPSGPAGRATGVNSAGFVISADTPNAEAAWEFVKFAVSPEGQSELAAIGLAVPILQSVAASDAYLGQTTQINHQLFVDALDYAHVKPVFRGYEEWSSAVGDALDLIWNEGESVEDGIAEAVEYGDAALAANR